MDMIVILQSKDIPITILFDKARPINENKTDMAYETFKTCLTDPNDGRYMDVECLMNTVFPVKKVKEIWPWLKELQGRRMMTCSNLNPVAAYPENENELIQVAIEI